MNVAIIQNLRNFFGGGQTVANMQPQSLSTIFDHPEISSVDREEYDKINESLQRYRGEINYLSEYNSNGKSVTRKQSGLNMTKLVCQKISSIMFNEQCEINTTNEFISETLNDNRFKKNLSEKLELMLATGGIVIRPHYISGGLDEDGNELDGKIKLSYANADSFIPLAYNSDEITEAVFPIRSVRMMGGVRYYYTLLEFHRWLDGTTYTIENELYKSTDKDVIGCACELYEAYPDLERMTVITELTRPIFVYIKTAGFNNLFPNSPLGLGLCDNSWNTIDRISRIYDEFDQEIRLGRRKILVSETMLSSFDENGNIKLMFNDEETIYKAIPGMQDEIFIEDLSSPIRTTQYESAIDFQLKTLESELGFSPGTFALSGSTSKVIKTATEVVSESSMTYQTRQAHINELENGIRNLIITVCEMGNFYDIYDGDIVEGKEVAINFDDSLFIDQSTKAAMYVQLKAVGLTTAEYAIKDIFNLSDAEAQAMAEKAHEETMSLTQVPGVSNTGGVNAPTDDPTQSQTKNPDTSSTQPGNARRDAGRPSATS
jgi:A118 family predicted phage portal protein